MAVNPSRKRPGKLWSRLHLVIRFLGLTGALAAACGLVLGHITGHPPTFDLPAAGQLPEPSTALVLAGGAVALFALLVEAINLLFFAASRRSVFGFNAVLQVVLAAILLVGVNLWSAGFHLRVPERLRDWVSQQVDWSPPESLGLPAHYARIDCTRDRLFTLPEDLREQLARLEPQAETTVIVYQRHKTFGALTDKPDRYDYSAERKVVEKVKDLVSLLREVGPQLRVEVLDVEEEGFDDKLERLTRGAPELRKAIEAAPENSIFIHGAGHVQQMSFNELYQLDRVASKEAQHGRGNLVLLGQGEDGRGIGPFARKVLGLEQRKPRIGILVIHEILTSESPEETLTLAGLRKSLLANGFQVTDVVLKKGWDRPGFTQEPAADTFEESKLERLDSELEDIEDDVKGLELEVKRSAAQVKDFTPTAGQDETKKLAELSKKYRTQLSGVALNRRLRQQVLALLRRELDQDREELASKKRERDRLRQERSRLDVDRISEARRLSDVKAKLAYALTDCDLLFIPRLTRWGSNDGFILPRLYRLDPQQVEVLRDFVKAGKPIFACFGPGNERPNMNLPPNAPPPGPDGVERLLNELGVRLGQQTILFGSDSKAFAARRLSVLRGTTAVEAPPLDFDSPTSVTAGPWLRQGPALPPNRLRQGLRIAAHSAGTAFDIRMRFPRPVYYEAQGGKKPAFDPVFLISAPGWNEEQPFATGQRVPRFTPPSANDPNNGTIDMKRRGTFPVGVAVEVPLPESWGRQVRGKTVRVAAIGQGDAFMGARLSPARERMFLQTANWLLGRDDYLPRADHPWAFPRLDLEPGQAEHDYWIWGAWLGLPVLFAYLGIVVLLVRRLR
jgi:hypothetical protein